MPIDDGNEPSPFHEWAWWRRLWLYLTTTPGDRYHRDYLNRLHCQIAEQKREIAELRRLLRHRDDPKSVGLDLTVFKDETQPRPD